MALETALVQDIRSFNRFYTNVIGLLDRHVLNSPFSLAEARVLLEISQAEECTASKLTGLLNLDPGYLSRIIKGFERRGLVYRQRCDADGRSSLIRLTREGHRVLESLIEASNRQIEDLIKDIPASERLCLVHHMQAIRSILSGGTAGPAPTGGVRLRHGLRPGDIGHIIHLHGVIYAAECGYNHEFEGYVCDTFRTFAAAYSPRKDRLWLAEAGTGPVGSIAILGHSQTTAQLRWFLIHPLYRGRGLGWRMFNEALDFCRERRYDNVFLLTTSDQQAAIHMYEKAGFVKTEETPLRVWGRELSEIRYQLNLVPGVAL